MWRRGVHRSVILNLHVPCETAGKFQTRLSNTRLQATPAAERCLRAISELRWKGPGFHPWSWYLHPSPAEE